jgi:hypothetical protein
MKRSRRLTTKQVSHTAIFCLPNYWSSANQISNQWLLGPRHPKTKQKTVLEKAKFQFFFQLRLILVSVHLYTRLRRPRKRRHTIILTRCPLADFPPSILACIHSSRYLLYLISQRAGEVPARQTGGNQHLPY